MVIAIIAVLAVIAVPVTGSMLDRGADATDLGNLKQIGTAISAFAAENNGRVPNDHLPIPGTDAGSGNRTSFMESVDRMLPPDSKFSAGSVFNYDRRPIWYSKRFAKMPDGQRYDASRKYYWGFAWGMNTFLFFDRRFSGYLSRAPNLSKLVLVGEKNRNGGHDFKPNEAPTFEKNVLSNYRISRGSGGTNNKAYYLFADYHVESIAGDQSTLANPSYNSYSPTNRLYYKWW